MIRHFCDRCGADVTGKKSSAVSGIADADPHRNGSVTTSADLCPRCYKALLTWLTKKVA